MIQICIAKITGYGPWTLTLGSDREHVLQMPPCTKICKSVFLKRTVLYFPTGQMNFLP